MTELTTAFATALPALHGVDLAPYNARITTLEANAVDAADQVATGKKRQSEARNRIDERRSSGPDAEIAAQALLTGGDVRDAIADPAALAAELAAINAGVKVLSNRAREATDAVRTAKNDRRAAVAGAADTAADAIDALVIEAAERLADLFASAEAISHATGSHRMDEISDKLRPVVSVLSDKALIPRDRLSVPAEIVEGLGTFGEAIETIERTIPASIKTPVILALNPYVALMMADLAKNA